MHCEDSVCPAPRPSAVCQACRKAPVSDVIDCDAPDHPYHLCEGCAHRLQCGALRPLEWYRLALIHGWWQPSLHEDLYLEDGEAMQPSIEVEEPDRYPMPTLREVEQDVEAMVDYALVAWQLDARLVAALRRSDPAELLSAIERRHSAAVHREHDYRLFELCAVAGPVAATWLIERLSEREPSSVHALAAAISACLPEDRGFALVAALLDDGALYAELVAHVSGICNPSLLLAPFGSRRTLKWMETHQGLVLDTDWGRVAAVSHFSWPTANRWLETQGPLAAIALDAIAACSKCQSLGQGPLYPVLEDRPPVDEMLSVLRDFAASDPEPRARRRLDEVLDIIAGGELNKRDTGTEP